MKKWYAALVFTLLCVACWTQNITIQIVQHDDACSEVGEATRVFEDAVIGTLFDEGIIVSNEPALAWSKKQITDRELKHSVAEAMEGYAQYLVLFDLNFKDNKGANPEAVYLSHIDSVAWRVLDEKLHAIYTGKLTPPAVSPTNDGNSSVIKFAKDVAITMLRQIRKR